MNSFSLLLFIGTYFLISNPGFSENHEPLQTSKSRPVQPQSSSPGSKPVKGRWTDEKFEYLDENHNWTQARAAYRTKEPGTFLDINGITVEYAKGDILFKGTDDGWYKAQADDPAVPNPEGIELSETERLVIKFTNEERMKRGLTALKVSPALLNLSRQKSANMAKSQNLSHGVPPRPSVGGENIAWNQADAKEVVRSWMNSDGHRANILNRGYSTIGVGMAVGNGPYWTQQFQ